jgi:hypothetical protein
VIGAEDGRDYAADGGDLSAVGVLGGWKGVEVTEQFVGSVDEVDVQRYFFSLIPSSFSLAMTLAPASLVPDAFSMWRILPSGPM